MTKITTEVNGKKYELERYYGVSVFDSCKSCDLRNHCCDSDVGEWGGLSVCDVLNGFWKEIKTIQ